MKTIFNLLPSEFFALVVFAVLNLTVVVVAIYQILKAVKRREPGKSVFEKLSPLGWIFILLVVGQLACIRYGAFVEPYELETNTVQVSSPKLSHLTRDIRVVHFSDMHCDSEPRLETRLPDEISKLNPDLILFTGDAANTEQGVVVFRQCMSRIAKIAPTFAVFGNHDTRSGWVSEFYKETNINLLNCQTSLIKCEGEKISITGVPVDGEQCLPTLLKSLDPEAFNIFLYHYPDIAEKVSASPVDLFCAGHTHGGQVKLPFYGAIVTRSKTGKKFEDGLYKVGSMNLNVNRGIGMASVRIRFLCKPQVTLIELSK